MMCVTVALCAMAMGNVQVCPALERSPLPIQDLDYGVAMLGFSTVCHDTSFALSSSDPPCSALLSIHPFAMELCDSIEGRTTESLHDEQELPFLALASVVLITGCQS